MLPVILTSTDAPDPSSSEEVLQDVDPTLTASGGEAGGFGVQLENARGSATEVLSGIDFQNPTWDLFIILFFLVGAFLYGMSLGRDRIIVILVSLYMALAVVNTAPFLKSGGASLTAGSTLELTTFLTVFAVLFFLVSRMGLMRTLATSLDHGPWWQVLSFSILQVGLMVSIVLTLLPLEMLARLSPQMQAAFVGETAQFAWVIAPIIAMIMVRGDD